MKKLTKSQFYDLLFNAGVKLGKCVKQRKGQALFNELVKIDTELAKSLCGTENDPYYNDDRIDNFIKVIYE